MQLPSIDQNVCGQWTEQQVNAYNKLPVWMMVGTTNYRKYWPFWEKLLGKIPWKPNVGDTLTRVAAEPTPIMRQQAFPNLLSLDPTVDVINYRERTSSAQLRMQDFISPTFNFLPEFQDFMKHVDITRENIDSQVVAFEDIFYRTSIWHNSPYVWLANAGLVAAPTGVGNAAGTAAKTNAWIQAQLAAVGNPGYLSFETIFKALSAFESQVGATPYSGTGMPGKDSNPLDQKFCLALSGESWNQLVDDPWLKENRPINMNVVTETFKGDLFGRVTCKLEKNPFRMAADANFSPTFHAPEVTEENPTSNNFGGTMPNPSYADPAISQYEVAYLIGGKSYDAITVGAPPSAFTKDPSSIIKMNWNGKAYVNGNILVQCKDQNGVTQVDTNSWGRKLRLQASLSLGISAMNPKCIMPIVFKRRIGVNNAS